MNLCDDNHPEVCFDGRHCPVCEVMEEKDGKITELEGEVRQLQSQVEELSAES